MRTISASEAKTHFLRLLDEVENGAEIVVTRHGHPVVRLLPEHSQRAREAREALDRIRQRRSTAPRISVEDLIASKNEGRLG